MVAPVPALPAKDLTLQHADPLLEVHIAEYQALMNRNTAWITVQYAMWPILPLYATLAATAWNSTHTSIGRGAFLWGGVLVLEVLVFIWQYSAFEQYNTILYLQTELKPTVQTASAEPRFWMYEEFQARQRGRRPMWWEYMGASSAVVACGAIGIHRLRWWQTLDWAALFSASAFAGVLVVKAFQLVSLRKAFASRAQ